jgi:saccharopine dehydrogenase (NAD+, L-lysine forming)
MSAVTPRILIVSRNHSTAKTLFPFSDGPPFPDPLPIYTINTTFDEPTVPVKVEDDQSKTPLSVISIDHLPSMLPREASESFSAGLKAALLELKDRHTARVWVDAEKLFNEKVALLPENLRSRQV